MNMKINKIVREKHKVKTNHIDIYLFIENHSKKVFLSEIKHLWNIKCNSTDKLKCIYYKLVY